MMSLDKIETFYTFPKRVHEHFLGDSLGFSHNPPAVSLRSTFSMLDRHNGDRLDSLSRILLPLLLLELCTKTEK